MEGHGGGYNRGTPERTIGWLWGFLCGVITTLICVAFALVTHYFV